MLTFVILFFGMLLLWWLLLRMTTPVLDETGSAAAVPIATGSVARLALPLLAILSMAGIVMVIVVEEQEWVLGHGGWEGGGGGWVKVGACGDTKGRVGRRRSKKNEEPLQNNGAVEMLMARWRDVMARWKMLC